MLSTIEKGTSRLLHELVVQDFKRSIRGRVVTATEPSYDEERAVYDGMINRYPALIVKSRGGNFGGVTSFLFNLMDAGIVHGGPMLWHIEDSEELLRFYRDFILKTPNEIYCYFAFLTVPPVPIFPPELHLKKMCALLWCNIGDTTLSTKDAFDTFRKLKEPALDYAGPIPFAALQLMFDLVYPKGLHWRWKADFVKELSDEAIKLNVKHGNKLATVHSTMHLYPINGQTHKKKNEDTAFSYRDASWARVIVGIDPDPKNAGKLSHWTREYWSTLDPFSAGGAYVNFMRDEGQDRVQAAYRENYGLFAKIKSKYDPKESISN